MTPLRAVSASEVGIASARTIQGVRRYASVEPRRAYVVHILRSTRMAFTYDRPSRPFACNRSRLRRLRRALLLSPSLVLRTVRRWSERARTRKELLALPDRILQDVGLTRAYVVTETDKPFWRP